MSVSDDGRRAVARVVTAAMAHYHMGAEPDETPMNDVLRRDRDQKIGEVACSVAALIDLMVKRGAPRDVARRHAQGLARPDHTLVPLRRRIMDALDYLSTLEKQEAA